MKLNKILMIALLSAVVTSQVLAYAAPRPKQVKPAVDKNNMVIENVLNVKDKDEWHTFRYTANACQATGKSHKHKKATVYEYKDEQRTVLFATEPDGSCKMYVKERILTPDEIETIMIEDLLQD